MIRFHTYRIDSYLISMKNLNVSSDNYLQFQQNIQKFYGSKCVNCLNFTKLLVNVYFISNFRYVL